MTDLAFLRPAALPESVPDSAAIVPVGVRQYATFTIGNAQFAIELASVHEALECPAHLDAFPAGASGVAGAIARRGSVLPVLDFRTLLDIETNAAPALVVVIDAGGSIVGLMIDELGEIVEIDPSLLASGATRAEQKFLVGGALHPTSQRVLSVIDALVLTSQFGVPEFTAVGSLQSVSAESAALAVKGSIALTELLIASCGDVQLGIPIDLVDGFVPSPVVKPSVLDGSYVRGFMIYRSSEVRIVDLAHFIGLAPLPRTDHVGCVAKIGNGLVSLAVGEVNAIAGVDVTQLRATVSGVLPNEALVRGVWSSEEHGTVYAINGESMVTNDDMLAMSRLSLANNVAGEPVTERRDAEQRGFGNENDSTVYLRFVAGGLGLATPLDGVSEMIPVPHGLDLAAASPVLGSLHHRNAWLPIVSLGRLLGVPDEGVLPEGAATLVVSCGADVLGFVVDRLEATSLSNWSEPFRQIEMSDVDTLVRTSPAIRFDGSKTMTPGLDLKKLVEVVIADRSALTALPLVPRFESTSWPSHRQL